MARKSVSFAVLLLFLGCGSDANPAGPAPIPKGPEQPTGSSLFSGSRLFVDPGSQAAEWVRNNPGHQEAALIRKIAEQPQAIWLAGGSPGNTVRAALSQANGSVPVFVAYQIPNRDCGSHSSGGASSAYAYQQWVRELAAAMSGGRAAVILEPDALSHDCGGQQERLDLFNLALQAIPNCGTSCYLDAGHPKWRGPGEIAERLVKAGISHARGFSLNVSNFQTTEECIMYGRQVSAALESRGAGPKHFVIDQSRNGLGGTGEWCNPPGRALGNPPTVNAGDPLVDALLWIKRPGESDGECNGGPRAGVFWPSYAAGLASRASW